MKGKFISVLTGGLLLVGLLAIPEATDAATVTPHHCGTRQISGQGNAMSFCKNERVDANEIHVRINGHWWIYYSCLMSRTPSAGFLVTGITNPNTIEARGHLSCSKTQPSPGDRRPTGVGGSLTFSSGNYELGFAIESHGYTFFSCLNTNLSWSGTVIDGVVNPNRFEMKGQRHCSNNQSDLVSGAAIVGIRQSTGDGNTLTFSSGVGVLGAYIQLTSGEKYKNCYIWQTDNHSDGFVISGVVSFWPVELKNQPLPGCGSAGTIVS